MEHELPKAPGKRPAWRAIRAACLALLLSCAAVWLPAPAPAQALLDWCRPATMSVAKAARVREIATRHAAAFRNEVRTARRAGQKHPLQIGNRPNFFTEALARHLMATLIEVSPEPPVPFSGIARSSLVINPWADSSRTTGAVQVDADLHAYTIAKFYRMAGLRFVGDNHNGHVLHDRAWMTEAGWSTKYIVRFYVADYPDRGDTYIALHSISVFSPHDRLLLLPPMTSLGGCPRIQAPVEGFHFVP